MNWMFSNRARLAKLMAALLLLLGLGFYASHASYWQCKSLDDCLTHPANCDGQQLVVGTTRIAAVMPEGFSILTSKGPFFFQGRFPGLSPEKYADIELAFHAPDRFQVMDVHVYLERTIKIWGSLAAALIMAGLLIRVFGRRGF